MNIIKDVLYYDRYFHCCVCVIGAVIGIAVVVALLVVIAVVLFIILLVWCKKRHKEVTHRSEHQLPPGRLMTNRPVLP